MKDMGPSNKLTREEIKKIIVNTLKPTGAIKIALFGSFARNDLEARDIDILVTLPDISQRKLIGMKWFVLDKELERALGYPVDLVTEESLDSNLRAIIQKDIEIIYEKAG